MPPHFDLLYRIWCNQSKSDSSHHLVPAFRDAPVLHTSLEPEPSHYSARSHLNGTVPVLEIQALMENDTDGIAIVVIRTVECSEASIQMARADGTLRWTEAIYMKSNILKHVMHQIAACYFQPVLMGQSTKPTAASFEKNRVHPAELVLFHHRHLLQTYASENCESKQHIDALLGYMNGRYARKFAEADDLFERGLVTQAHILYLFRPNEVVISGTYEKPAAFVLQDWPELRSDGCVTLSCWSFQTDGSGFARKHSSLSILPIGPTAMKIQDLVAYPLRFATSELRELIRSRGEKQWEIRTATQITYKGWDVAKNQFFVSLMRIILNFIFS